eukprot:g4948.t1
MSEFLDGFLAADDDKEFLNTRLDQYLADARLSSDQEAIKAKSFLEDDVDEAHALTLQREIFAGMPSEDLAVAGPPSAGGAPRPPAQLLQTSKKSPEGARSTRSRTARNAVLGSSLAGGCRPLLDLVGSGSSAGGAGTASGADDSSVAASPVSAGEIESACSPRAGVAKGKWQMELMKGNTPKNRRAALVQEENTSSDISSTGGVSAETLTDDADIKKQRDENQKRRLQLANERLTSEVRRLKDSKTSLESRVEIAEALAAQSMTEALDDATGDGTCGGGQMTSSAAAASSNNVKVEAVKTALTQWANQRKDEAVALKKEVQDLKKKKHLMLAMMHRGSPNVPE